MATWNATNLAGASIDTIDTSQKFTLGQTCCARQISGDYEGEFIYMKGVASCVLGSWVLLDYASDAITLLVDADVGGVGVAMGALAASTFGWCQIRGAAEASLAASCADNAELYTTATAGTVDDVKTGQFQIYGARCAETVTSAAVGEVEIHYPQVAGPDAA